MEKKINVVICDDMEQIREYFQNIVDSTDDMQCVGTCATAKEGLEIAERVRPDVILMDIQMESGEGHYCYYS